MNFEVLCVLVDSLKHICLWNVIFFMILHVLTATVRLFDFDVQNEHPVKHYDALLQLKGPRRCLQVPWPVTCGQSFAGIYVRSP